MKQMKKHKILRKVQYNNQHTVVTFASPKNHIPPWTLTYDKKAEIIGKGSYGVVYRGDYCVEPSESLSVAIKIISNIPENNHKLREYTNNECEKMKQCQHPNALKVLQSFWQDQVQQYNGQQSQTQKGTIYIVTKLCCFSLMDLLMSANGSKQKARQLLKEETKMNFLSQLVSAVYHVHKRLKLVHRDIKSGNILIDKKFQLQLADFGCSKLLESSSYYTSQVGTWKYCCPQIFQEQPEYTNLCDSWGIGVVLYELATFDQQMKRHTLIHNSKKHEIYSELETIPAKLNQLQLLKCQNFGQNFKQILCGLLELKPKQRWSVEKTMEYLYNLKKKYLEEKNFKMASAIKIGKYGFYQESLDNRKSQLMVVVQQSKEQSSIAEPIKTSSCRVISRKTNNNGNQKNFYRSERILPQISSYRQTKVESQVLPQVSQSEQQIVPENKQVLKFSSDSCNQKSFHQQMRGSREIVFVNNGQFYQKPILEQDSQQQISAMQDQVKAQKQRQKLRDNPFSLVQIQGNVQDVQTQYYAQTSSKNVRIINCIKLENRKIQDDQPFKTPIESIQSPEKEYRESENNFKHIEIPTTKLPSEKENPAMDRITAIRLKTTLLVLEGIESTHQQMVYPLLKELLVTFLTKYFLSVCANYSQKSILFQYVTQLAAKKSPFALFKRINSRLSQSKTCLANGQILDCPRFKQYQKGQRRILSQVLDQIHNKKDITPNQIIQNFKVVLDLLQIQLVIDRALWMYAPHLYALAYQQKLPQILFQKISEFSAQISDPRFRQILNQIQISNRPKNHRIP